MENIGYGLGALANLKDLNNIIDATPAKLYTQTRTKDRNRNEHFDKISHSAYVSEEEETLMSYGPRPSPIKKGFALSIRPSTSTYNTHVGDGIVSYRLILNRSLFQSLQKFSELFPYQGLTSNCVNWASLGTWLNGIPNIGLHPFLLHGSIAVYNSGAYNVFATQFISYSYGN